ncbi:hypothetical protein TrST_g11142 [Triparma strigata]|uniref:Uncharacterized protein n=1 Tax=Triparma strigata TaxID=1606541 RepID=A0A9W7C680_9STRA|nr:hypothetical protein TrST_g11142 [Triparma strigata]
MSSKPPASKKQKTTIASYFKVLDHPINATQDTPTVTDAYNKNEIGDDVEDDVENDAESTDSAPSKGPLVPSSRPCSSVALTLLSSRLHARSPYTLPPSMVSASFKRFRSRSRPIPPPANVYTADAAGKAVTHLTTSGDGLLLSVGYACGLIEVYHVDDIEHNDMNVPFKKKSKSSKASSSPPPHPLTPIAQFLQFNRARISCIAWDPTLDVTYVSYVGSLRIAVIDWNTYLSSSASRPVPYTSSLGVKCVPHINQTTFPNDRDTISCILTVPASKSSSPICKSCGSTKCIIAGTKSGSIACYCLSSKHPASKSCLWTTKVKYDGSINAYPNHSNEVKSVHRLLHNNVYYVATFSGHGQVNVFNLCKIKKGMMGSATSPLKVFTVDIRDVCAAFRNVDFRENGGNIRTMRIRDDAEKENDEVGGDFVSARCLVDDTSSKKRFEYDSVENNVLGYGFKNVIDGLEKPSSKQNSLDLTFVLLNGCVYSGALSCSQVNGSAKFKLRLEHCHDNAEGKRYAVINHVVKPAIDARYVKSIHKGLAVLPKGYLLKYKPHVPISKLDVTKALEEEGRGESEFDGVRRRLEKERGGVVQHWKWGHGAGGGGRYEWKVGDIKCLVSVCGGRYIVVGGEEGMKIFG